MFLEVFEKGHIDNVSNHKVFQSVLHLFATFVGRIVL